MNKLDIFQDIFGKKEDYSGWWYLERISAYAGTQFTSMDFQDKCQTRGVQITIVATEHQEMN